LTATPLQVAAAYAAIADGGRWHRPHVMRRIATSAGDTVEQAAPVSRDVISPEVAATMKEMLIAVTQKGGTAEKLQLIGYTFAGKTGTAQKVDPVTRHYSTDKWASSFVGFAPAKDPRLVLFVMIDEPYGTHYGSMVAGPVFAEVMADALRWLGVPPDATLPPPEKVAPTVVESESSDDGEEDGYVAAAYDTSGETAEVPDFTGMSLFEALDAAKRSGLRLEVTGTGRASAQSPGPGEARKSGACKVVFTPPS
jgi:cell division protein FtsI (penicillin-binding protein 3)